MYVARRLVNPFLTWFRLLRDSWHTAAVSVGSATVATAAAAIAGRELGASAFGSVGVITAYFGWFTLIGSYPCFALVPSFLANDSETETGKKRGIASVLLMKTSFSGLATLAAVLMMPVLMPGVWKGDLRAAALIYAIAFFQGPPRAAIDVVSQAAGWLRMWSASSAVASTMPLALLIGFALTPSRLNPRMYMILIAAAGTASLLFSFVLLLNRLGGLRYLRPRIDVIRPFLAAGRGPWLSVLGGVLTVHGVRTIIATHLPNRDLGLYDVSYQLISYVTGVGMAVSIPALSQWSRMAADGDIPGLRLSLRKCQAATAAVMGTVGTLCIIFPRLILLAVYGSDFIDAAPVLQAMGASLVLGGAGGWYWMAVYAVAQPQRVAVPNVVCSATLLLLAYLIVRFTAFGITGAAAAYTLSVAAWLAVYEREFKRAISETTARTTNPQGQRLP